jgi:hypothetical protein
LLKNLPNPLILHERKCSGKPFRDSHRADIAHNRP